MNLEDDEERPQDILSHILMAGFILLEVLLVIAVWGLASPLWVSP